MPYLKSGFPDGAEDLTANVRDVRDVGSIPGLGRSPEEGHGNPLQYSCLENPMDKGGTWKTIVHRLHKVGHNYSNLAHSTHLKFI